MDVCVNDDQYQKLKDQLVAAQQKLAKATQGLEIALDNASAGLIYIDRNFVVQWESTKIITRLFKNKAYVAGEVCYKTVFHRDSPCEQCAIQEMFTSNQPVVHTFDDGNVTVELSANPVYSPKGAIIGGVLKIENITNRVSQDKKITELNHLMDAILNNIPVDVFVKDPADDFRYLYWNKSMANTTQVPVSKVLGNTDFEVFPNIGDAEKFRSDDQKLLATGQTLEFQESYVNALGQIRTVNTIKALIPSSNKKVPWMIGVSWDVSQTKKIENELTIAKERAEQSNRLKSAFLANMSHEIRTPLNAIVGFSELLVGADSPGDKAEYISIIKKNNDMLLQLISDILDISKIEAQSLEFVYERVDVNALCRGIVAASNLKLEAKVPVVFADHLPECYIDTDRNRINQVVSNLVNNALKFTLTGSVAVGYNILNDTEIEFYVKDSGVGIASNKLDAVFGRFVKLDAFVQGTGLGLSICKSIVERLHGRIGVESQQGVGSRFWFTHPYDKSEYKNSVTMTIDANIENEQESVSNATNDSVRTILVAEDIDSNYLLLYSVFKKQYNLIRAYNGLEAVELCEKHNPDIVLMDIKMPVMDGLEATRKIRERDKSVPIIALTAFAFDSDKQQAKLAGCNDFISKPISIAILKSMIIEYIK